MARKRILDVAWAALLIAVVTGCATGDEAGGEAPPPDVQAATSDASTRNPFGLPDISDCCGEESRALAAEAPELGRPDDPNAEVWHVPDLTGEYDSLDGKWASRWSDDEGRWQEGVAEVRVVGDRMFIQYEDLSRYLIEAAIEGKQLIGRYMNAAEGMEGDTSPWVGTIVGNDRIDGAWLHGRWDFRRDPADAADGS